jgi:hypothetical protein
MYVRQVRGEKDVSGGSWHAVVCLVLENEPGKKS